MSDSNKLTDLKEKLKQALISTFKVIADDFHQSDKNDKNKNLHKYDFLDLDNLNTKADFIKARAESDSSALKKKFSNTEIYKKNLPLNTSCRSLYSLAEKIRCETLGGKMLKGIQKNFTENYNQIINIKRKDHLKTKEDVTVFSPSTSIPGLLVFSLDALLCDTVGVVLIAVEIILNTASSSSSWLQAMSDTNRSARN